MWERVIASPSAVGMLLVEVVGAICKRSAARVAVGAKVKAQLGPHRMPFKELLYHYNTLTLSTLGVKYIIGWLKGYDASVFCLASVGPRARASSDWFGYRPQETMGTILI